MVFRRIRDLREDSDKTQIEIADYLNMQRSVYHVTTDYLLGLSDKKQ